MAGHGNGDDVEEDDEDDGEEALAADEYDLGD